MRMAYCACILSVCVVVATSGCSRSTETPATPTASSPQNTFSYEKQVGLTGAVRGGNVGCLAIFNDSLAPGAKVILADQPPPNETFDKPAIREAIVVERVAETCDHHLSASHDFEGKESYYRIRTPAAEWQGSGYQFAIIDPKQPLSVRDGKVAGDIDGDGTPEFFRTCPSNEGVHYQVWTGAPLEGRGRWHWYVYAGYDLEYGCTEREYFGPK